MPCSDVHCSRDCLSVLDPCPPLLVNCRVGDFTTAAEREAAIDALDNTTIDGCRIRVKVLVSVCCIDG